MRRRHMCGLRLRQKVGIFLFVVFCGGYVAYGAPVVITTGSSTPVTGNSDTGTENNNTVQWTGGAVTADILGGSGTGSVIGNTVEIDCPGANYIDYIAGGYKNSSAAGDVKNNTVYIKNGTMAVVSGGESWGTISNVVVQGNKVIVSGGAVTNTARYGETPEIDGGYAANNVDGTVLENEVTITGGAVYLAVGGKGRNSLVQDNVVDLQGGSVTVVYAGVGQNKDVINNTAKISTGTIGYQIMGGLSEGSGNVIGNSVIMTGGTVLGPIPNPPGTTANQHAAVSGGLVFAESTGSNGSALNNVVTISGGQADTVIGGEVSGAKYMTTGDVKGNKVIMSGGQVIVNSSVDASGAVTGGSGWMSDGEISGNSVEMSGGETDQVNGGALVSGTGSLKNNSVKITGGKVTSFVIGGSNASLNIGAAIGRPAFAATNVATEGNEVTIGGSAEVKNVIGGLTESEAVGATNSATKNIVNIEGSPKITGSVYGGWDESTVAVHYDLFTGNTLNKNSNATLPTVLNFEKINFAYSGAANITKLDVTPAITAPTASDPTGSVINTGSYDVEFAGQITGTGTVEKAGSGELLLTGTNNDYTGNTTVTAGTLALKGAITASSVKVNSGTTFTAYQGAKIGGNLDASGATLNFYVPGTATDGDKILTVGGSADVSGSTVNVGIDGSSSALDTGDEIILIDAASRAGVPSNAKSSGTAMKGVTLQYDFELITNTTQLIAKLLTDTTSIVPPMGAGTLNPRVKALSEGYIAGISLINQGGDLIDPSKIQNFSYDFEGFAIMNGGSSRYNTGSHVDLKSFSVVAGVTKGKEVSGGKLMFGGFFEYGTGSYDTYNSFTSLASVRGDGDLSYFGGGILGRMDFKPVKSGNFYLEGSLRAGRIKNKYSSKDLQSVIGTIAAYSKTDGYAGFHLGAGYRWNITEKTELDLYTKYFYTKEKGDHVILSTGDDIHFKDVTSSRIRIGGRLSGNGEKVKPYAGLAWEYEGDGKARATTSGLKIGTPSLTGSTGIAELGVKLTPSPKWTLDIGIQGYVGEREGVTGSLRVKYVF